jgi:nucleoside-diphosphate-sugar epimerase
MHVFVTGATGHIGSVLVPHLVKTGHQVTALARSSSAAVVVKQLGATPHRGDLEDLDGLREAARTADGVVHLAFREDAMRNGDVAGAVASDVAAVRTLGEALEGTGKAFVSASAMLPFAGRRRTIMETDTASSSPRIDGENHVIALADRGVRSSVVRLSPLTHSPEHDRHGFAKALIATARRTGISAYVGDGAARWSAAHTRDTARLLALALDRAPAGSRLHSVGEEGLAIKTIATAIGAHLGLPAIGISADEAVDHFGFGFLAGQLQTDAPASNALTRGLVGWEPTEPGLLSDLRDDRYYAE